MRRFVLSNKPGYDIKQAVENPSYEISIINVVDNDGTILDQIQWTPTTDYMYDPQPDPTYQKPYKIKMQTGEMVIPPIVPEDMLTSGENPFVQLLYRYAKKQNRKFEDFVRHITQEKKLLPKNPTSIQLIKNIIDEMYEGEEIGGLLIKRGDSYTKGVDIKHGRRLIKLHNGIDPFEHAILDRADKLGTISLDELNKLLSFSGNMYQWARYDSTIDYYIKKLLKQGNIERFGKDWFRFKKYPDRMV